MSKHYLDTLFKQIPSCLHAASFSYFNARAADLSKLLSDAEPSGTVSLLMDHLATRTVCISWAEAEKQRNVEKSNLEQAGYLQKQEIHYTPWKWTVIYGHGPSQVTTSTYKTMKDDANRGNPSTFASVFSTFYILDRLPEPVMSSYTTANGDKEMFDLLSDATLPIEIKAVFIHHSNGFVNHIALTTPNLVEAKPFLVPFSTQYVLNDLQIGDALNQQSTWDVGNDYIELVERHTVDGMIQRHEFKIQNTEPLFRSTSLGVLRMYSKLATEAGQPVTLQTLHRIFPDATESINFLNDHHLLFLD